MAVADHRLTTTCGSSAAASTWRATQRTHILNGRFSAAMEMDVVDIQGLFGSRYDVGITSMLDDAVANGRITAPDRGRIRKTCGV